MSCVCRVRVVCVSCACRVRVVCTQEGSGVVGIVLTVLLFVVLLLVALFVLYAYLVKLHLDGRLLDLYRRLCAPESAFLIPHDMEVRTRWCVYVCVCLVDCGV